MKIKPRRILIQNLEKSKPNSRQNISLHHSFVVRSLLLNGISFLAFSILTQSTAEKKISFNPHSTIVLFVKVLRSCFDQTVQRTQTYSLFEIPYFLEVGNSDFKFYDSPENIMSRNCKTGHDVQAWLYYSSALTEIPSSNLDLAEITIEEFTRIRTYKGISSFQKSIFFLFQCQPTALLRSSGSAQRGQMALSVVIFESRTVWADHITCGMIICIVFCRELRLGDYMYNCLCSVIVLYGMMTMKGREKVKPGSGSQPAPLEKHQGGRQA